MAAVRRRTPGRAGALLLAATLLAACSDGGGAEGPPGDEASPTATSSASDERPTSQLPDVAVVLPARNARPEAEIEVQRALVAEVADDARRNGLVDEVRVVLPDRFSTVGDVVEVLAEQGYDLVCALGPGAARGVREVATRFPATRFCATPGRLPEVAPNSLVFDLRVEEAAYLAGIAARFAAATVPDGRGREPAVVFGDPSQVARLVAPFDEGFFAVRDDDSTTAALVAADADVARAAAASQYDAGAFVVYTSAGRAEAGVVEAAREADGLVVGWAPWLGPLLDEDVAARSQQPDQPEPSRTGPDGEAEGASDGAAPAGAAWDLLQFREDLSTALRDAIVELGSGWTGGSRSLGFANGALEIVPGTAPAWARVRTQVLDTEQAIIRGDIVVQPG